MRWIILAAMAGTLLAGPAQAACPPATAEGGTPISIPSRLDEAARLGLSAMAYLAVADPAGGDAWPRAEIATAPSCPAATFQGEDQTWNLSTGVAPAPMFWAQAQGDDEIFYIAEAPALVDAQAWSRARTPLPPQTAPRVRLLVGEIDGIHVVYQVYEDVPGTRRLSDDIVAIQTGKLNALAAVDPAGHAVTILRETESGREAELFRPGLINRDVTAQLYGPDGAFFHVAGAGVIAMRGSGVYCAPSYGGFSRSHITVIDSRADSLDLSCLFRMGDSWVSVFATRQPNAAGDKASFTARIRDMEREDKALKTSVQASGVGRGYGAGRVWDRTDGRQDGLWFRRAGEFVVEVRATFDDSAKDALLKLLEAFASNRLPSDVREDAPA
ncbi:hypothetical protein [Phenylobacterium sp.]|jgi:hypothetical protein|uniref:hypothetical protein n=1 Tax=Phenylobacterium sp. TaxID=1871053 RepID=UPI0037C6D6DB